MNHPSKMSLCRGNMNNGLNQLLYFVLLQYMQMGYNRLILDNLIWALNNEYIVRADKIHGPSRYEKKYYAFTGICLWGWTK